MGRTKQPLNTTHQWGGRKPGRKSARETIKSAVSGMNASARVATRIGVHQNKCVACDKVYKQVALTDNVRHPDQFPGCCTRCISKKQTALRKRYAARAKSKTCDTLALVLKANGEIKRISAATSDWTSAYDARSYLDPTWEQDDRRMPRKPKTLSVYPDWITCTVLCADDDDSDCSQAENLLIPRIATLLGLRDPPIVYGDAIVLGYNERWIDDTDVQRIQQCLKEHNDV